MRYALIVLMLAGCANTYTHPTQTDIQRDAYECERDAAPVADRLQARFMMDRCLRAKGWVRQ